MQSIDLEHQTGAHCGSTALVNLSNYYGWGCDEPECFGLGTGLGFSYLEFEGSPYRGIMGRTGWLEQAFFDLLGIEYEIHDGESFEGAWESITAEIDRGNPVLLFTDIYYLDYFNTSTHFSPHVILAVGYDDEDVLLADSEFPERQRVPIDRLKESITSKHVVPLQCRYITFDDPTVSVSFEAAAREAIAETATYMLDPDEATRESRYFPQQGIEQIEAFAADLPTWSELPDPSWTTRFAYQNVERRGTGGGTFRRLYAKFLERAAEVIQLPDGAPEQMHEIADQWTSLGETLYEASETDEKDEVERLLEEASDQAVAIAAAEREFYEAVTATVSA